jgi:hypothetical protein
MLGRAAIERGKRNILYRQTGDHEIDLHPPDLTPDTRYFPHSEICQPGQKRGEARPRGRQSYGGGNYD